MFGQPEQRVNRFVAVFDSDCYECGGEIYEDDEAGYLPRSGGPSCSDCIDDFEENR